VSNTNAPFGLGVVNENGLPFIGAGRLCYVPAAQAGNIFAGDPIVALGGSDAFGVPSVGIATAGAGNAILGVCLGISNGPAAGGNATSPITFSTPNYRQGGVANYIWVADDPNQVYAVQEDSNGGAIAQAVGAFANGNLVAGAGGSTTYGTSGWMLQSSSVSGSANATYQVRILGLARGPDNAIGNFARWLVRLNNPQLWGASGV
jgi:lipoprotein-anchoring transpeptidase ErfK/SrfK